MERAFSASWRAADSDDRRALHVLSSAAMRDMRSPAAASMAAAFACSSASRRASFARSSATARRAASASLADAIALAFADESSSRSWSATLRPWETADSDALSSAASRRASCPRRFAASSAFARLPASADAADEDASAAACDSATRRRSAARMRFRSRCALTASPRRSRSSFVRKFAKASDSRHASSACAAPTAAARSMRRFSSRAFKRSSAATAAAVAAAPSSSRGHAMIHDGSGTTRPDKSLQPPRAMRPPEAPRLTTPWPTRELGIALVLPEVA